MGNIIVTGGAGFIGSHTVDKLLDSGTAYGVEKIAIIDNFRSGSINNFKNIEKKATILEADVGLFNDLSKKLKEICTSYSFMGLIHLAAVVSLDEVNKDPILAVKTNVQGTLNLLEIARRFDIGKFVYASSVAVYGEPIELPIDSDHPTRSANLYGLTKLMGEQLALQYFEDYGIQVISLRYFNVYGPRMRGGQYAGVIHKFITKMLRSESPTIFGDGSQTRDFVYVEDVAEANVKALFSKITGVFNIGTGVETSIIDLYKTIAELVEVKDLKAIYKPPRKGDIKRSLAKINRAKERLGWSPKTSLRNGLMKTVKWYKA